MAILKPLVIFMAILIFALFGVVVWRMVVLFGGETADTAGFPPISLGLAPTCQITAATLDGDRLTVVTGPVTAIAVSDIATCNAVHIIDIADGTVIGNVKP
ncbi:MAG: hypothetical protein ACTSX7_10045 [Alphaproteobacteria bacterium]